MKKIWDISPPIDENAAVFPGDTAYSQRLHFSLSLDCPVNVNSITLSPHTGAHADAPLHYAAGGATSGDLDLTPYLGRCRVVHLAHAMHDLPERVLIRASRVATQDWGSFTAIAGESIAYLATHSIANRLLLVGLDTPSVDPASSQTLPSHQMLHRLDLRVLENLVLDDVPEGDYELIALPLKLVRADASPVRAILREL
jgi:arylformamidase